MYNSEENFAYDENRNTQSQPASVNNDEKVGRLNNSRPKNMPNMPHRNNGISGTYARIVPKKPVHDIERLYAENMQLREKIKFLQEDNTKTKTRMSMAEREKQQLINQLTNLDYNNNALRDRRPSLKGIRKNQQKSNKTTFDQNRRILHSYKDQVSKLQLENGRLKKTVKYTQIKELETENQLLHEQMARMKRYVQDALDSLQYDEYQKQIDQLKRQLQGERDSAKSIHMQLKKKDEQIQEVKNKMRIMMNRKTELQKKYNRDISNVKGELYRVKERQKQLQQGFQNNELSKQKRSNSISGCKNCQKQNEVLQREKSKTLSSQQELKQRNRQISELKNKIKELQKRIAEDRQSSSPSKTKDNNFVLKQQNNQNKIQQKMSKDHQKSQTNNNQGTTGHQVKQQQEKQAEQQNQDYEEDQDYYQYEKEDQSEDKVDVFHVNLSEKKKSQTNEKKDQNHNFHQQEDYGGEQFNDIQDNKDEDSQQQVLFQKQQKNNNKKQEPVKKANPEKKTKQKQKQKQKQKIKPKQKQKEKQKQKQKQKGGSSKAQKILKQSIKYRLIAQRYTFSDFKRDIKESQVEQFDVETLVEMLTNQPFFLGEDHLQMVMYSIFRREEIEGSDIVSKSDFLKTMRGLIEDFKLKQEAQQQKMLSTIKKKIKMEKVYSQMEQQSIDGKSISKKGFMKVLKQTGGLTDAEIEQCLAEASVLSIDIAHINYQKFLQKIASIHK